MVVLQSRVATCQASTTLSLGPLDPLVQLGLLFVVVASSNADIRRGGKAQPAPPFVAMAQAETPGGSIWQVEIPLRLTIEPWSYAHGGFERPLSIDSALMLLDEFSCDDAKDLFNAFTVFGRDLVAAIPERLLTPEA